jgi:hypothetical protein
VIVIDALIKRLGDEFCHYLIMTIGLTYTYIPKIKNKIPCLVTIRYGANFQHRSQRRRDKVGVWVDTARELRSSTQGREVSRAHLDSNYLYKPLLLLKASKAKNGILFFEYKKICEIVRWTRFQTMRGGRMPLRWLTHLNTGDPSLCLGYIKHCSTCGNSVLETIEASDKFLRIDVVSCLAEVRLLDTLVGVCPVLSVVLY